MGEIVVSICLGGLYIVGGIIYVIRLKREYKSWSTDETKGEK